MKLESQDLNGKKQRVQQQIAEKQEQWERLGKQLSAVERAREYEGDPIKKMEHDERVNALEKERETVEERLTTLESILREINRLEGERSLVAQYLLTETATWGISRINAMAVWDLYDARGADVTIGHLDTGVDASHPDLQGK